MKNIDRLQTASSHFHPDTHHQSVAAVMADSKLSRDEKRGILSAWASDMYAVESSPEMRMIPGHAAPIRLSAILAALRELDRDDPPPRGGLGQRMPSAAADIDARGCFSDHPRRPIAYRIDQRRDNSALRAASMWAHRNNIRRYNRLLATELTALERDFIQRRIGEEKDALRRLADRRMKMES
jgi:hypothetical protein